MSSLYGADVAALRSLAAQFSSASTRVEAAARDLTPGVTSGAWQGPDAQHFRQDWSGRLAPTLGSVSQTLAQAALTLRAQADEQERTSDNTGGPGAGGPGGGSPGGLSLLDQLTIAGKGLWKLKGVIMGALKLYKAGTLSASFLSAGHAAAAGSAAAASARVFLAGGLLDDVTNSVLGRSGVMATLLAKVGGPVATIGRWAGPIGGIFQIGTGIAQLVDPSHDGWRGVGDRVAGGLSIIGGAGTIALALGAGAALGPVGVAAVVGAGLVAGAWQLGNYVYDNREAIGQFASTAAKGVTETAGKVVGAVADGASKVKNWIGGLFT